jgi:hypothetical protein
LRRYGCEIPLLETVFPCPHHDQSPTRRARDLTYLLYEPVYLIHGPFLPISRVVIYVFSHVCDWVIKLTAYHSVADSATSFIENNMASDCLFSIHHQALYNNQLTTQQQMLECRTYFRTRFWGPLRFSAEKNPHCACIRSSTAKAAFIILLQTFSHVW